MTRDIDDSILRMDRREIITMLGGGSAAALAGCISMNSPGDSEGTDGGNTGQENASSNGSQEMADSIVFWDSISNDTFDYLMEQYTDQYDVTIENTTHGKEDLEQKFQTRLASGTGAPDLAYAEYYAVPSFVDTDGLRDLSSRIEESGIKNDFISGVWESIELENGTYGFPFDLGPTGIFYRRDKFQEYGLEPENMDTWDAFIEEGKKLPDDVALISIRGDAYASHWMTLYRQLNGHAFTEDGAINISSEKAIRAAEILKKMAEADVIDTTAGYTPQWYNGFKEGTILSICIGAWFEGSLKSSIPSTSGQWGVFKQPAFEKGGNRASNWGGSCLMIPSQISEPKANRAWDFVETTMTNPENMATVFGEYGKFPALSSSYDHEIYSREKEFFDGQAVGELWTEVAPNIPEYRITQDQPTVRSAMNTALRAIIEEGAPVKDELESAAERVSRQTDREISQ